MKHKLQLCIVRKTLTDFKRIPQQFIWNQITTEINCNETTNEIHRLGKNREGL